MGLVGPAIRGSPKKPRRGAGGRTASPANRTTRARGRGRTGLARATAVAGEPAATPTPRRMTVVREGCGGHAATVRRRSNRALTARLTGALTPLSACRERCYKRHVSSSGSSGRSRSRRRRRARRARRPEAARGARAPAARTPAESSRPTGSSTRSGARARRGRRRRRCRTSSRSSARCSAPRPLVTRPPGYVLASSRSSSTSTRFERLRAEARDAGAASSAPRRSARRSRSGAAPPLADFAFEPFAQSEIRAARGAAARRARGADRRRARAGPARRARRRARGARRAAPAAGAAARPADARALPRPAGRPRRSRPTRRAPRRSSRSSGSSRARALQQLHGAILAAGRSGSRPAAASSAAAEDHFDEVAEAMLAGRARRRARRRRRATLRGDARRALRVPAASRPSCRASSQYVAVTQGSGPLYDELHALLERDATPTPVHRFFASLPPLLRERGAPHQLIVTTSYDPRSSGARSRPARSSTSSRTSRRAGTAASSATSRPTATARLIEVPNTYATELSLERRTVILKLHGRSTVAGARVGELRRHRGRLHRLPRQTDVAGVGPGRARGEAAAQPLPLPRLHDGRLEPARGPRRLWGDQPLSYRSWAVQPEREAARARVLAAPRRRRARRAARASTSRRSAAQARRGGRRA